MRPTQAHIDLRALRHNLSIAEKLAGEDVGIIPVVKADAYGHGAVSVGWALAEAGVQLMAVASIDEALELLESGVPSRLLVFGGITGETNLMDIPPNCIPVIWDEEGLNFANTLPGASGRPIEVHIKVDTGMTRLGCEADSLPHLFDIAAGLENIRVTGVMSHLSSADGIEAEDSVFTHEQILRFRGTCRNLAIGIFRHLANSAGLIEYPESRIDAVRPGIMLYGIWPFPDSTPRGGIKPDDLKPVMSMHSTVLAIKEVKPQTPIGYGRTYKSRDIKKIAVIPAGYADGISRKLSNCGQVLIGGKRRDILGSVTMDYLMVDASESPPVYQGDEVVFLGKQGVEEITAWEIANWEGAIPYEVTCGISRRVTRISYDELGRR